MIELSKADWCILKDTLNSEGGQFEDHQYKGQMLRNTPDVVELLSRIPNCKFRVDDEGMIEVEDRFPLLMYFCELASENIREERPGNCF